jgi:hypothetical protein
VFTVAIGVLQVTRVSAAFAGAALMARKAPPANASITPIRFIRIASSFHAGREDRIFSDGFV